MLLVVLLVVEVFGRLTVPGDTDLFDRSLGECLTKTFREKDVIGWIWSEKAPLVPWGFFPLSHKTFNLSMTSHISVLEEKATVYIVFLESKRNIRKDLEKLSWNSEARFIFIEPKGYTAQEILFKLWKESIFNAVVLERSSNKSFDVLTWFPYQDKNCGAQMTDLTLLEVCQLEKTSTVNWFPDKIPAKLTDCPINVCYIFYPPFAINLENGSTGRRNDPNLNKGVEINILDVIARVLEVEMVYVESDMWGEVYENNSITGNLLDLYEGRFEIVVGGFTITHTRARFFQTSGAYLQDGMVWCVPHSPIFINEPSFSSILYKEVWLLVIILLFTLIVLMWQFSQVQLQLIVLRSFYIILGGSFNPLPKNCSNYFRFLLMLLLLFAFNLDSAYLTYITSILSFPLYKERFETMDDIYNNHLITYLTPTTIRYFNEEDSNYQVVIENWNDCQDTKTCMEYVAFRRDTAMCVSVLHEKYIFNKYMTRNGDFLLNCFKENLVNFPVMMFQRKNFPLAKRFNKIVRSLQASGFIQHWYQELIYSGSKVVAIDDDVLEEFSETKQSQFITLSNLIPMFWCLLVGYSLGLCSLLIELYFFTERKPNTL